MCVCTFSCLVLVEVRTFVAGVKDDVNHHVGAAKATSTLTYQAIFVTPHSRTLKELEDHSI